MALDQIAPVHPDERVGCIETMIEVERTDQCLGNITKNVVTVERTIIARLFAELQIRRNPDPTRDFGTNNACYQ